MVEPYRKRYDIVISPSISGSSDDRAGQRDACRATLSSFPGLVKKEDRWTYPVLELRIEPGRREGKSQAKPQLAKLPSTITCRSSASRCCAKSVRLGVGIAEQLGMPAEMTHGCGEADERGVRHGHRQR